MHNPFADVAEPPDTDEVSALPDEMPELSKTDTSEPLAAAPGDEPDEEQASTPVLFPVVLAGPGGQPVPIPLSALERPAQRVAELVEGIQAALVPPPVIAELEALVAKANCLEVTDAESFRQCSDLYELLHANEKGIEETIGPIVGFFHRPHNAMTKFRARFAGPVAAAKRRLSDCGGAWQLAERRRAEADRQAREDQLKRDEQERLRQLAATATKNGDAQTAAVVTQMVEEVTAPALPLETTAPVVPTKGRERYVVDRDRTDAMAIYKGIAAGTIPMCAAPLDFGYLDRQAKDLGTDMPQRFPGVVVKEKGGLTAAGKR